MKRILSYLERLLGWITERKVRLFLFAASASIILLICLDMWRGFDGDGVLVEAHGMLFDILLFGIILTLYEQYTDRKREREEEAKEKQRRIERYQEELDDYRGWESDEAAFRVAGIVKRLLKEGVKEVGLANLHIGQIPQIAGEGGKKLIEQAVKERITFLSMKSISLVQANLEGADLQGENLEGVNFKRANLNGANLNRANLNGTNLNRANLQEANLQEVSLIGANLISANLQGANLFAANLNEANLNLANLNGATLVGVNLEKTSLREANLESANPERAYLKKANLERASLRSANLRGAYLKEANLQVANLELANLQGAILQGAKLKMASLKGATAYLSQKPAFAKVMTQAQLNSITWVNDKTGNPISPAPTPTHCSATTRKGNPCKLPPQPGSDRCHRHKEKS